MAERWWSMPPRRAMSPSTVMVATRPSSAPSPPTCISRVEIGKRFRLVRNDVMKATARKQEPFTCSLPSEDFIFNPG